MEHHESAASFKISMFFKCILYTRNKSQGCPTRLNATRGATRNKIAKNVHVCARFLFFMIGLSNNGTFSSFTALSFTSSFISLLLLSFVFFFSFFDEKRIVSRFSSASSQIQILSSAQK